MYDKEKRESIWNPEPVLTDYLYSAEQRKYYSNNLSREQPKFDSKTDLDIFSKRAALKVAPSVVAIVYYSDEEEIFHGSGIIIESNDIMSIVLTSSSIRKDFEVVCRKKCSIDNLKVIVYSSDGKSFEGKIFAYDNYYNLAAISFHSDSPLLTATLAHVDDSMSVQSSAPSFELLPSHSRSCNLTPGYKVVAVGRYFYMPFDLMAVLGAYCIDRWEPNFGGSEPHCKELFKADCKITRCGDGGPLINHSGEIIGIAFCGSVYGYLHLLPFMPINIAYKWWEHYKKFGEYRRPFLGMEVTNLYAANLGFVERLIRKFPSICKGVIIEKVLTGFSAEMAGLCVNDVIIECGGKTVHSFLEVIQFIFSKKI